MKYNKILAGVLTVSVVSCLMITYTGGSSGTPPTQEELLSQSHGLVVTSNKETVYPDEEGMWRYRLSISPEGDSGVLVQKLEIKCYTFHEEYVLEETFDSNDFKDWWGSPYIPARETRDFGAGLPSRNNIYYRDHTSTGIDDMGNAVKGTIRVHFSKEKKPDGQEESLWERKWAQQPSLENTRRRVDNPEDYDVQGLRVNADFKVDVGEWWPGVEEGTYWVPAATLGTPDNTKEELLQLKGKPEEARETIDVLFEALAFIHLIEPKTIHNAETQGSYGIRWEFPKPAGPAIRDSSLNCASAANVIHYLLEDDYDEVGYVWRHSSFEVEHPGGHCTSYIKENGKYYFFDPGSLAEERSHYPVEDGDGTGYHCDDCDRIIQSTPRKYAIFWTQRSYQDEAIFAMFSCSDNHFALGTDGTNLYYPKAFDPANLTIWTDPNDSVGLLQASYSPEPPKNQYGVKDYAEYKPYMYYGQARSTKSQGEKKTATIPSDN